MLNASTTQDRTAARFLGSHGGRYLDFTESHGVRYPLFVAEFWTARQRQACSLHEITYRGCFKPQLPRFFINRCSSPGDRVYDPFSGRGTTAIESGLMGRRVVANDINPLSNILTQPRFFLPEQDELEQRLLQIPMDTKARAEIDLSMFYDRKTEAELVSLRDYLSERRHTRRSDHIDEWIRMIATNRLTGHSPGFFSVYTLPPNQAVSPKNQIKINEKRAQQPEYRDVRKLILRKSRSLRRNVTRNTMEQMRTIGETAQFVNGEAGDTPSIASNSVQVTVTSPPFLNVIQYSRDNWLRCWFNCIDVDHVARGITMSANLESWSTVMQGVLHELYRITQSDGWVFFEVGEVRKGKVKLEEAVIPLGLRAGFICLGVLINTQTFTKTANIWGILNNHNGTNTNRIVLLQKPPV